MINKIEDKKDYIYSLIDFLRERINDDDFYDNLYEEVKSSDNEKYLEITAQLLESIADY